MANTLRFKRGLASGLPTGAAGEPLFTTDTFDLYIGNGTGNTRFQKYIASGSTTQILRGDGSLYTFPLAISSPSNGQVLKYNGTSWVNDSDSGITGSGSAGQVAYFTGATTQAGSNNLFWDSANNRLGVGTASPIEKLSISGNIYTNGTNTNIYLDNGGAGGASLKIGVTGTTETYINSLDNDPLWFGVNNTERMRLTSTNGNLHIGTFTSDSGEKLQVNGTMKVTGQSVLATASGANVGIGVTPSAWASVIKALQIGDIGNLFYGYGAFFNTNNAYFNGTNWIYQTSNASSVYEVGVANHIWYNASSGTAGATMTLAERMRLDASGNLGLGTTPSAWSLLTAFDFGNSGSSFLGGSLSVYQNNIYLSSNAYYNSGWKYKNGTNPATNYEQSSGAHQWFTAPSGSANAAITFTQAMTLDASGNLGVGTASPSNRFHISAAAGSSHARWTEGSTTIGFVGGANGIISGITGYMAVRAESGLILSGQANAINLTIHPTTGNIIINNGTSDSGEKLQVTGTAKITGITTFGSTGGSGLRVYGASGTNQWDMYLNGANIRFSDNTGGGTFVVDNAATFSSSVTANSFVKSGGTSSQYLMADGSVSTLTNPITGSLTTNYLPKATGATTLGNSNLFNDASGNLGLGTATILETTANRTAFTINGTTTVFQTFAVSGVRKGGIFVDTNRITHVSDGYMSFETGGANERARIFATGNFGIGTGASDLGQKLQVIGAITSAATVNTYSTFDGFTDGNLYINANAGAANTTVSTIFRSSQSGGAVTERMRITTLGNLHIGTFSSDSGEKLQVNGTMKVTGASSFGGDLTVTRNTGSPVKITVNDGSNTTSTEAYLQVIGNSTEGYFSAFGPSRTAYKILGAGDVFLYKSRTAGDIAIFNDESTGNIKFAAGGSSTAQMTLDASGNLLLGMTTAPSDGMVAIKSTGSRPAALKFHNANTGDTGSDGLYVGYGGSDGLQAYIYQRENSQIIVGTNNIEAFRVHNTQNVHFGGTSSSGDTGERLQVTGTAKITGATSITNTMTSRQVIIDGANNSNISRINLTRTDASWGIYNETDFRIYYSTGNTTTPSTQYFSLGSGTGTATFTGNLVVDTNTLFVDATNNKVGVGTVTPSSLFTVAGTTDLAYASGTSILRIDRSGALARLQNYDSGSASSISLNWDGGNVGIGMTPSYKLDVTGSARVSDAIAIGTTPDSNNPFKILKNLNTTVGIKFENTNTSSSAFSAVQLGTDISGGTKFTNLVYSSSGVSASGVYNPDGTSLINNGSGGLNFLGNPVRIYTGGSNGVLRWDLVSDGYITHYSATAPTTSATDGYRQYSADITAGNAAPHFRTENGAVIKLYQETTAVGNSTISVGGGNAVLDDTEFDGYTLRQLVRALRNQGILQ